MSVQIDARRLLCPMPVIRLQDAIEPLDIGAVVQITCTDPGALQDIPAWCRINGHSLQKTEQNDDDEIIFTVLKQ